MRLVVNQEKRVRLPLLACVVFGRIRRRGLRAAAAPPTDLLTRATHGTRQLLARSTSVKCNPLGRPSLATSWSTVFREYIARLAPRWGPPWTAPRRLVDGVMALKGPQTKLPVRLRRPLRALPPGGYAVTTPHPNAGSTPAARSCSAVVLEFIPVEDEDVGFDSLPRPPLWSGSSVAEREQTLRRFRRASLSGFQPGCGRGVHL